jgi:PAS domain S-box-containing protein
MNPCINKKLLAGLGCSLIGLMTLGYLYVWQTSPLIKVTIALAIVSVLMLSYFFYDVNFQVMNQLGLEEEVRSLKSDFGERKHKEVESEKIYRSLAANIPGSAITILDREERYLLAEGDMLARMGYVKENMPGRKIADVITPENYSWYKTLIDGAFAGQTILKERKTVSGLDALIRVVPLRNEQGLIYAIMFVLLDVTVLKKVQEELAELNSGLEMKIAKATERLLELNKELEGFAYSVSHDLRAPLRAISGYSKILQEEQVDKMDDAGLDTLGKIINSANRMDRLIDDLLEFSRLGRTELIHTRIDMNGLVNGVIQDLTSLESTRKLNIRCLPLEDSTGDLNMVRQVWFNLVSNALKYTRKKESADIEIISDQRDGMICYCISDNGAGFDMSYADKLFGVFQRLHKMKDFEGTGVGLALVKSIVKRHGGKVWAEAKVNEGAKFYFTLPMA